MARSTICCLGFAGICVRHGKKYGLLLVIYWYLYEVWREIRFCCVGFIGICERHVKKSDFGIDSEISAELEVSDPQTISTSKNTN